MVNEIEKNVLDKRSKILVTGSRGMVGSALVRALKSIGYTHILSPERSELDFTNQVEVLSYFQKEKPEYVFMAAAKVGGIFANNTYPAEFIYQNLMIEANTIHSAFSTGVKRLLFLGSACVYPKLASQPMSESSLLTGLIEPTNEPYAIAKLAGIKLCESYNRQYGCDFRSVLPANLYGQGDNFHPENSHVIPAMMRRFHQAKLANLPSVEVWGSGNALREFVLVDDMAKACVSVMNIDKETYNSHLPSMNSHINLGTGKDISIRDLAHLMKSVVGYKGNIVFDSSKPDGAPRKLCDATLMNSLGVLLESDFELGLRSTYDWFIQNVSDIRY